MLYRSLRLKGTLYRSDCQRSLYGTCYASFIAALRFSASSFSLLFFSLPIRTVANKNITNATIGEMIINDTFLRVVKNQAFVLIKEPVLCFIYRSFSFIPSIFCCCNSFSGYYFSFCLLFLASLAFF